MKNCTCDKLDCDVSCLCACHREETFSELVELNNGLDILEDAIDICIERMQKYNLK